MYLRDRAIQTGQVSPEELGLVFHAPGGENPFGPPPTYMKSTLENAAERNKRAMQ